VAILAVVAALQVQTSWSAALSAEATSHWWIYPWATIAATTMWLSSVAWLHWRLAREARQGRFTPARQLVLNAVSDLLVAAFAWFILREGHRSPVALAGVWLIPPTLLSIAAPSTLVLLASAWAVWRAGVDDNELLLSEPTAGSGHVRTAIVVTLFLALGGLASRPLPAGGSHPANHDELGSRAGGLG
jgi:hypothetical protein